MKFNRAVFLWLVLGLVLVYFQIIIGGVTRLTGSGLSITKWEIVTGTLPPLSNEKWIEEFEKYRNTPQYQKINSGMDLKEFKFIYFWEYFHRLWARAMGIIFLIPFCWFFFKNKLNRSVTKDLGMVVLLALVAASFGWIMVASGLVNRPWVNAYKLSIHLGLGISVFAFLFWSVLKYRYGKVHSGGLRTNKLWLVYVVFALIIAQLLFGGLMSGMKASLFYPTWPDIGGQFIPADVLEISNYSIENFKNYDSSSFVFGLIQFVHRTTAYILVIVVIYYYFKTRINWRQNFVSGYFKFFAVLLIVQIVLGIITLINSIGAIPVLWGVLHQGVGVLLLMSFIGHLYFLRRANN